MQIEKIIQLMSTDDSVDAPAGAIKAAKNVFRERVRDSDKSVLQRIVAVLRAELSPDRPAFGERSASALKSHQLLFTAGSTGIDLRLDARAAGVDIRGQILSEAAVCGDVRLFDSQRSYETRVDDLGEFDLRDVAKGTYSMSISCGDREIFIDKIDLR